MLIPHWYANIPEKFQRTFTRRSFSDAEIILFIETLQGAFCYLLEAY